jgi:DNA-binding phage protein
MTMSQRDDEPIGSTPTAITADLRRKIADVLAAEGLSHRDLHAATEIAQSTISRALSGAADAGVSTIGEILAAAGYELRVGQQPLIALLAGATDPPLSAVVRLVDGLGFRLQIEPVEPVEPVEKPLDD